MHLAMAPPSLCRNSAESVCREDEREGRAASEMGKKVKNPKKIEISPK
jgi:hypothetical protein